MAEEIKKDDKKDDKKERVDLNKKEQIGLLPSPKKDIKEEMKSELLAKSEISLWLDTYDDIFSDFDPRPYSQRSLSEDFLSEARKASREKTSGNIELRFLVPKIIRKNEIENTIKKRLREHFRKHLVLVENEIKKIRKEGLIWTFVGILIMIITTVLLYFEETFIIKIILTLFEPAGWFTFWHGLDTILSSSKEKKPEFDFYSKMTKADIIFVEY